MLAVNFFAIKYFIFFGGEERGIDENITIEEVACIKRYDTN